MEIKKINEHRRCFHVIDLIEEITSFIFMELDFSDRKIFLYESLDKLRN